MTNRQWTGAYYLTGLAVECALKACLARAVREHDYPDRKFVNGMYQHNLQNLIGLDAALLDDLKINMTLDPNLEANWKTVRDWDDEKRYDIVEEQEANALFKATVDPASGVMTWIRGKW